MLSGHVIFSGQLFNLTGTADIPAAYLIDRQYNIIHIFVEKHICFDVFSILYFVQRLLKCNRGSIQIGVDLSL